MSRFPIMQKLHQRDILEIIHSSAEPGNVTIRVCPAEYSCRESITITLIEAEQLAREISDYVSMITSIAVSMQDEE